MCGNIFYSSPFVRFYAFEVYQRPPPPPQGFALNLCVFRPTSIYIVCCALINNNYSRWVVEYIRLLFDTRKKKFIQCRNQSISHIKRVLDKNIIKTIIITDFIENCENIIYITKANVYKCIRNVYDY